MKNILYIFIPLLFLNCSSNFYTNSVSEISDVDIKFENGEIMNGKLEFPIYFNQKYLYFKSVNNGNIKLNCSDISEITYKLPNEKIVFIKNEINGTEISSNTNNKQFLQQVSKGKVNLYLGYNQELILKKKKAEKFPQRTELYYCKRENEQNLNLIYYKENGKIITKAKEYFFNSEEFRNEIENQDINPEFIYNFINKINNENK